MPNKVYKGPTGKTYALTETDVIWLARSIRGECGANPSRESAAAVAWTMMNRFMLVPGFAKWTSYTDLIRAFSQPVNPAWFAGGLHCRPADPVAGTEQGKFHGKKDCDPEKTAWRAKLSSMPLSSLGPAATYARAFAEGTLDYPRAFALLTKDRPTNWGAVWLKKKLKDGSVVKLPEATPWGVTIEGNHFFEDAGTLPGGKVSIAGFAALGAMAWLLLGSVIGGAAYLVWRIA
jgi:hypothetical protein